IGVDFVAEVMAENADVSVIDCKSPASQPHGHDEGQTCYCYECRRFGHLIIESDPRSVNERHGIPIVVSQIVKEEVARTKPQIKCPGKPTRGIRCVKAVKFYVE